MKKIILVVFVFVSFLSNAQETEFTFTSDKGMTDFIVTSIEGKTATDIYKKVIEWIKVTYKNPDKVILTSTDNEFVRFEGYSETLYSYNAKGQNYLPAKYQIEISMKDGKYKFDIINFQILASTNTWVDYKFFNNPSSKEDLEKGVYNKDGSLKSYCKYFQEIPTYFNNLNKSLSENIISTVKKSDGW